MQVNVALVSTHHQNGGALALSVCESEAVIVIVKEHTTKFEVLLQLGGVRMLK